MLKNLFARLRNTKTEIKTPQDVNSFTEFQKKEREKMKYNCKNCNYHWEGNLDTFQKVLNHEKTHLKNTPLIDSKKKL